MRPPIPAKRASFTNACKARSAIVGIPKGRFSSVPGLGIQTLLVGFALWDSFSFFTSSNLWTGESDLIPSTPAVFLPWLSCVTRRTAKHFADQDRINVF
jgi:hypothetical protein